MATVTGLTEYQARLRALPQRVRGVVLVTLKSFEGDITGWMGANAPWEDRPDSQRPAGLAHARKLLHAWTMATAESATLYVAQGATYGVFLELAHQGRYGILWKAIRTFKPLILKTVRDDLQRAFGGQWVATA